MSPRIATSHLADVLDKLDANRKFATGGFRLLGARPGEGAIGPAFTVQQGPLMHDAEGKPVPARHGEAGAKLAAPGDILVIDVKGEIDAATWGEAHTLRTAQRGLKGVVVNGLIRDVHPIDMRGLPVLCRGSSPRRSGGRISTHGLGLELTIAGVRIRPGDLVAIDVDGLVCVPAEWTDEVLARARAIADKEITRNRDLTGAAG